MGNAIYLANSIEKLSVYYVLFEMQGMELSSRCAASSFVVHLITSSAGIFLCSILF